MLYATVVGTSPKTCAPVLCDSVSYVEEVRAYLCVHKKRNTHRSMTSSPATLCRWGRGYAELRLNGVLRSSPENGQAPPRALAAARPTNAYTWGMKTYTYPHTIDNGAGGERLTFLRRVPGARGERLEVEVVA